MLRLALIFILFLSSCGIYEPLPKSNPGCFEKTLRSYLSIHDRRAGLYSDTSGGASNPVMDLIIPGEQIALWNARGLDEASEPYVKGGVPLLCDDFAPVSQIPPFQSHAVPLPPAFDLVPHPVIDEWMHELRRGIIQHDFEGLQRIAESELKEIGASREYFCMLRFFIKSIRRSAAGALVSSQEARARGLDPALAEEISMHFIDWMVDDLPSAEQIDYRAALLQEKGIPIVCGDFPQP